LRWFVGNLSANNITEIWTNFCKKKSIENVKILVNKHILHVIRYESGSRDYFYFALKSGLKQFIMIHQQLALCCFGGGSYSLSAF